MAYSPEIISRATARLKEDRERYASRNRARQEEAYQKMPRLRQIDAQLSGTLAKVAQAALSGNCNIQEEMARLKQENLSLQQERASLMAQLGENAWDERPFCPHCGGTGYIGRTMCQCLHRRCQEEQMKELTMLSGRTETFNQFRLDYYSDTIDRRFGVSPRAIMEQNLNTCYSYAAHFTEHSGNLLFVGGTGLGKTFLSACIAKVVTSRGYSVAYESAPHFFEAIAQSKFSNDEDLRRAVNNYVTCDLLILDDLGTEAQQQRVNTDFYTVLNDRVQQGKPMIISTNLNMGEISTRYSPQIASRIGGCFFLLTFVGEDIRRRLGRG